jgi:hypothetical protein
MLKNEKPKVAELNLRYGSGEEALAEQLWHEDGGINLSLLEVFSEVAPAGYEQDFVCDTLELIVELTKNGSSRREIARQILREIRDELVDEVVSSPQSFPVVENEVVGRDFANEQDRSETTHLNVYLAFNRFNATKDTTAEAAMPFTSGRLFRTQMGGNSTEFKLWQIPSILGLQPRTSAAEFSSQLDGNKPPILFFEANRPWQQTSLLKCLSALPFSRSNGLANDAERANSAEPATRDGLKQIVFIDGSPHPVAANSHRVSELLHTNRREMPFDMYLASNSAGPHSNRGCNCPDSSELECDPFDAT